MRNVTPNTAYEVKIQASTMSNRTQRLIMGKLSEPKTVYVQTDCDKIQQYMPQTTTELGAGVLAGVLCACFAFLLAVSGFILWR